MLSLEAKREFRKIYFEEFGEEISDEQAMELGTSLLALFDKVYRPLKREWLSDEEIKKLTKKHAQY